MEVKKFCLVLNILLTEKAKSAFYWNERSQEVACQLQFQGATTYFSTHICFFSCMPQWMVASGQLMDSSEVGRHNRLLTGFFFRTIHWIVADKNHGKLLAAPLEILVSTLPQMCMVHLLLLDNGTRTVGYFQQPKFVSNTSISQKRSISNLVSFSFQQLGHE